MFSTPITEMSKELVTKKETPEVDVWNESVFEKDKETVSEREFLTVTLKAGTGFDSPWLVFHANSVEEAVETLKHDALDELMDLTARKGKELAKAYGGSQAAPKASGGGSWGNKTPAAPAASGGAVEWDAEADEYTCNHGVATQRKGESAKGPWTGYFCPQPKGSPDQCSPKFLNNKR